MAIFTSADQLIGKTPLLELTHLEQKEQLHATILAIAAGRPVLPIVYSDKTKHVIEDLGFTGTVYDLREDAPWTATEMATIVAPAAEAQGHFEKLDQVLL